MFHRRFRNVFKRYARFTERLHVFRGHQEFILCDAVDRLTNALKGNERSLLIGIRGNANDVTMATVAHRLNFRRVPVAATFLSSPVHDGPPARFDIPGFQRSYQFPGFVPSHKPCKMHLLGAPGAPSVDVALVKCHHTRGSGGSSSYALEQWSVASEQWSVVLPRLQAPHARL